MSNKKEITAVIYCRIAIEPPTALYCRTATKITVLENDGIEVQKSRLLRFAKENGYTNPVFYLDNGESGVTLDRPALSEMIKQIKAGEIERVIIYDTSRLSRSIIHLHELMALCVKKGVELISMTDGALA